MKESKKESIKKIETKEEKKMEKSEKPEWLKEVEEKLTEDYGLFRGGEKMIGLAISEQLVTKEELKEFNKTDMQEDFENKLVQGWIIDGAKEVEAHATEKGIELELKKGLLQKGFESHLSASYINEAKEVEAYASEKGIKLNLKEGLQKGFEVALVGYGINEAKEVEAYASEKGIKLEFKNRLLQKGFEEHLSWGNIDKAKEVEAYASEKEIELNFKEGLEKGFARCLASRSMEVAKEIETYAAEKGIELKLKEEELQKAFEQHLAQGKIFDFEEVKDYAAEKGTELRFSKGINNVIEESYIRIVHNPKEGHAEQIRNNLIEKAREKGIELNYDKVVKMDYLDFLEVSKKDRFQQKKEVKIGKASLKSEFYGQIKENKCKGKFILAENPKTKEISFIFDATLGEHKDIGNKYDVDVIGGGWLEIDKENKKITINKKSQDFGYEPRMISAAIIIENFPSYEVNVEY